MGSEAAEKMNQIPQINRGKGPVWLEGLEGESQARVVLHGPVVPSASGLLLQPLCGPQRRLWTGCSVKSCTCRKGPGIATHQTGKLKKMNLLLHL